MSEVLERIQRRALELARSGKFAGWRAITFELQFEPALKDVFWRHTELVKTHFSGCTVRRQKKRLTAFVMRLGILLPAAILRLLDGYHNPKALKRRHGLPKS